MTETPIAATSSATRASRKLSSVESAQLDLRSIVQADMNRSKLFAGVAFAADLGGTDHRDYIRGTTGPDTIDAKGGSDFVRSRPGNDVVVLGSGRDVAWLGDGDDSGKGADWIIG